MQEFAQLSDTQCREDEGDAESILRASSYGQSQQVQVEL
jgi:hypothetical protein